MRNFLLILWLVSIGADRIDLLGGAGPLLLTPFLVLSPLVLVSEAGAALAAREEVRLPDRTLAYLLLSTLFLCTIVLSVFFSSEVAISSQRSALLIMQVYTTLCIAVVLANRPDPARILVAGAYGGLALGLGVSIAQVALWLTGSLHGGAHSIVNLTPATYGSFAPRVSGQSLDANRGGVLFFIYSYFLYKWAPPSRTRSTFLALGAVLMLATLSRSVLLAAAAAAVWLVITRRGRAPGRGQFLGIVLGGAAVVSALLLSPALRAGIVRLSAPLVNRFALGDESSSIHVQLIARGWDVATSSVSHALLGIGFGNAASVLHDFFPGSTYANFHSFYATLMGESGVVALCFGIALLIYPVFRARGYAPLVLGLICFNISYQTTLEPLFWFVLAAAWLEVGRRQSSVQSRAERTVAPVLAAT